MTPCRLYLTLCALSLAAGALIGLALANRVLMALEDARRRDDDESLCLTRDIEPIPLWLGEDAGMIFAGVESRRN